MKNGDIKDPGGWGMSYTKEDFEKISFLTPDELYKSHTKLCEDLYLKVYNELNSNKSWTDWYMKMLKNYVKVLGTIPQLEYVSDTRKYNL